MSKTTGAVDSFRQTWRDIWTGMADDYRCNWAEYTTQWENDTEPGYPLPPFADQRRKLALAVADLYDAIGGKR